MTLIHEYDGDVLDQLVRLKEEKNFTARAELGQPEQIGVTVDDDAEALDFVGYKTYLMREDACPSGAQVAWHGYVGDQVIGRGESSLLYPTGIGRSWDLTVVEDNGWLSRRILTGADCKRKAETVSVRLAWLLTKPGYVGRFADYGLVQASALMCDPNDYTNRTGADLLRDLALLTGFNFHARHREASDDLELIFLDFERSPLDVADFAISNVESDIDVDVDGVATGPCWPVNYEAKLKRAVSRVAAGMAVPFPGGNVYLTDAGTEAEFGPVDQVNPTSSVKTKSAATALGNRLLAQHSEQDERVTNVIVQLPAAKLTAIRQGQLMNARFSHLPGWEETRPCRALLKGFGRPEGESQAIYDVDLELTPVIAHFTGPAFAAILDSNSSTKTGPHFRFTGDATDPGWYLEPSVGPLTILESADPYLRIRADARMTLRTVTSVDFSCVTSGDFTVSVYITKNGVTIGTTTFSSSGGLRFESQRMIVDVHDVEVENGDIISVSTNQLSLFWDGFGTNETYLRVGRGTHTWDSGAVTWVGP